MSQLEIACPDGCPLKGLTHKHFEQVEGRPRKHKRRKSRGFDDDSNHMVRRSEQNRLYKRKR